MIRSCPIRSAHGPDVLDAQEVRRAHAASTGFFAPAGY